LHHDAGDAEIDQRFGFAEILFNLDLLRVMGRRHRVRHINDRGDAAAHRGGGAGGKILFVGHAGLSKMDVAVDQSRQNMPALDVDLFSSLGQRIVGADGDDHFVADRNAASKGRIRRHHPTVFDH
jgi:hypothetical protein